jgi:demethylmenaquinone methyltransferase/2-methoxy-6-polyprenyl-1,4-benzoquinol methylase
MQHKDEYQNTARIYDLLFSRALCDIRETVCTCLTHHKANSVIDLCCGTGEQLRALATRDMLLTGVETSQAMLHQARKKSPESIHYLESDAGKTELPSGKYDGVILTLALHEKPAQQHRAIFNEACRLVHPDGLILIADYCVPPVEIISQIMGSICIRSIERLAGINHYHNYKDWMANGAVEGFLNSSNPGKLNLISDHLKGCAKLLAVTNIQQTVAEEQSQ